jgi:hypothetical protein
MHRDIETGESGRAVRIGFYGAGRRFFQRAALFCPVMGRMLETGDLVVVYSDDVVE